MTLSLLSIVENNTVTNLCPNCFSRIYGKLFTQADIHVPMCPRPSADLQQMDDSCKTTIINKELAWLNIDVACLQETWMASSGSLRESDYTFVWQGLSQDEPRQHGVGLAMRNTLNTTTETPHQRAIENPCCLHEDVGRLREHHLCDALTLTSTPEATVSRIPRSEGLYLLGDFNAHVGTNWQVWPTCLGLFGAGRMNENPRSSRLPATIPTSNGRTCAPISS